MKYFISILLLFLAGCAQSADRNGLVIIDEIRKNGWRIPSNLHKKTFVIKTLITGTDNGGEVAIWNESGCEITVVTIGLSRGDVEICSVATTREKIMIVQSGGSIQYSFCHKDGVSRVSGDVDYGNKMMALLKVIKSSKGEEVDVEDLIK